MSRTFAELFEAAVAGATPETALDRARYWAMRRGRGEPSAEDVAREQIWESIVRAAERGSMIDAQILGPRGLRDGDWAARVGPIEAVIPARWAALAEPPLAPGARELRVLSCDLVTEELALRPLAPGEPDR